MNKRDQDTILLQELLEKYKFTKPVPEDARREILSSKKKNLVRVLKTVGAFSAIQGLFLSLYFGIKKLGAAVPITKFIISTIAATAITYGVYHAATTLRQGTATPGEKPRPKADAPKQGAWIDRITLYNGRVIEGVIISRGALYRVRTDKGVVQIPRETVKMIKPLRAESETGDDRQSR